MESCPRCATVITGDARTCPTCGESVPGVDATIAYTGSRDLVERVENATNGRLKIVRELGRGAMGVVFLANQASLGRVVAIKVLHPYLQDNPEIAQRFEREVRTQARLSHPNILTILDVSREGGLTFFLSPYVESVSLRAYLRDTPQLPIPEVIRILRDLGGALAYAHKEGIVHRDVKPENVIVDSRDHRMILTDFGIAKALSDGEALTSTRESLGTPLYMAPEQAEDPSAIDGRSDQYSLGLIGYEMLSAKRVFDAKTAVEILHKQKYEAPQDIAQVRPDAPQYLCAAIMRAVRKKPAQRFPTMEDFISAIQAPEAAVRRGTTVGRLRAFVNSPTGKTCTFVLFVLVVALAVLLVFRRVFG